LCGNWWSRKSSCSVNRWGITGDCGAENGIEPRGDGPVDNGQLFSLRCCIQYLRLVGRAKCLQQINRENILSLGKQSLAVFLIVSDYPPTSAINIFSNDQIYWPCQHSFSAMLHLSLSLSLFLSVSPLSCSLPTTFGSVFNTVVHYHLDYSINIFCKELFSFQRLHLYEKILLPPVLLQ